MRHILLAAALAWPALAAAAPPEELAQQAELDRARAEIAGQVQLMAYDLVDELVYGWMQDPVFDKPTPVVVVDVTVPVGLGTGLQALVENHLADVLSKNPTTHVQLSHCPACTAVVVHSGPEGTVVSRGHDDPAVLEQLGGTAGRHGLFLDLEAEGSWMVLRARLTRLTPDLPIVWARTLASSTATPALLREPGRIKSAAEAREEYLDTLASRGPLLIPLRFCVRAYAQPEQDQYDEMGNPLAGGTPPPPYLWVESGVELGTTQARVWTASLLVGASYVPQAYQGLMAEARVQRLLTGRSRSLTHPDLYLFAGGGVITTWGVATASFQQQTLDADALLAAVNGTEPRATFGTLNVGVDLRVGQRIGLSTFLETLPSMTKSTNIGNFVKVLGVGFHSVGTEVTFWF